MVICEAPASKAAQQSRDEKFIAAVEDAVKKIQPWLTNSVVGKDPNETMSAVLNLKKVGLSAPTKEALRTLVKDRAFYQHDIVRSIVRFFQQRHGKYTGKLDCFNHKKYAFTTDKALSAALSDLDAFLSESMTALKALRAAVKSETFVTSEMWERRVDDLITAHAKTAIATANAVFGKDGLRFLHRYRGKTKKYDIPRHVFEFIERIDTYPKVIKPEHIEDAVGSVLSAKTNYKQYWDYNSWLNKFNQKRFESYSAALDEFDVELGQVLDELSDKIVAQKPEAKKTDPFNRYAFASGRTDKYVPPEPDSAIEKKVRNALERHFDDEDRIKNKQYVKVLQQILSKGLYRDVFNAPKGAMVYRGMGVERSGLCKLLGVPGDTKLPKKGAVLRNITYVPKGGLSSSWTTELKTASKFASTSHEDFGIVLFAKPSANPNTFLSGDDGLYKIEDYDEFAGEHEAVGLGNINVMKIAWGQPGYAVKKESYWTQMPIFKREKLGAAAKTDPQKVTKMKTGKPKKLPKGVPPIKFSESDIKKPGDFYVRDVTGTKYVLTVVAEKVWDHEYDVATIEQGMDDLEAEELATEKAVAFMKRTLDLSEM